MDAMPIKRLIANDLETSDAVSFSHWGMLETDSVCAIGAVGKARGVDMSKFDPEDYDTVAGTFGIASVLAPRDRLRTTKLTIRRVMIVGI